MARKFFTWFDHLRRAMRGSRRPKPPPRRLWLTFDVLERRDLLSVTVGFDPTTYTANESDASVTLTVALSAPSTDSITVHYATRDGTGTAGIDYVSQSGNLTIPAGSTAASITVALLDDETAAESDETFQVVLSDGGKGTGVGTDSVATVTLNEDEDPTPTVQFGQASVSVNETDSTAAIPVVLNLPSADTVTVVFASSDGSASAGIDYTAVSDTLTFAPGQVSQTISVPLVDDDWANESDESFSLTLSSPTNADLGTDSVATVRITEDEDPTPTVSFDQSTYAVDETDSTATVVVDLSAPSALPVTVNYATSDGTATAGVDYTAASSTLTINPGQTSASLTITLQNDDLAGESDQAFSVTLTAPTNATLGTDTTTVTIADEDDPTPTVQFNAAAYDVHEPDGTVSFTVELSQASAQTVTVNYATSDGTALDGTDYTGGSGTLTFNPGVTSQPLPVPLLNDHLAGESNESFTLTLSDPSNADLGTDSVATVTLDEDDDPAPTVELDAASYEVSELGGVAVFNVLLSGPSAQSVTVNYATADGTALAGMDYDAGSGTLTFAPGTTSQAVSITLRDDDWAAESNESFTLTLSGPTYASLGSNSVAVVTLDEDEDPTPSVQVDQPTYTVGEEDGEAIVYVTLTEPSADTVTVHYATTDGTALNNTDYYGVSGTLTFEPGEDSLSIHVSVLDDGLLGESNESFTLTLSGPTNAELGDTSSSTMILTEDADPTPSICLDSTTYNVNELDGTASVDVTVSGPLGQPVTVNYATSDGTATAGDDYTASSGTVTFTPGGSLHQTITIPLIDDHAPAEGDQSFTVTLSAPSSNATLGATTNATVNISEDSPTQPAVELDATSYEVHESDGSVTLTLHLSAASDESVLVNYQAADGTASAGIDYGAPSGTLTFGPGDTRCPFRKSLGSSDRYLARTYGVPSRPRLPKDLRNGHLACLSPFPSMMTTCPTRAPANRSP